MGAYCHLLFKFMVMKQILCIAALIICLYACADKEITEGSEEKGNGLRNITLTIQKAEGEYFGGMTKAKGSLVPSDYTVLFYLFERVDLAQDPDYEKFRLIRREQITAPLYTIKNLRIDGFYQFVFIAAKTDVAQLLSAKDFATAVYGNESNTITLAGEAVLNKSLLSDCYLELFGTATSPTYGDPNYPDVKETFVIDQDLEIFGDGFTLIPGTEYATPVNVLMQRQLGVVEFECPDAQEGDVLTASFSSDYYRLYLSQMVRDINTRKYTSENQAVFSPSPLDWPVPPPGDYYSSSFYFLNNVQSGLPVYQKTQTMAAGQKRIRMYLPYTSADTAGTVVPEINKANYKRTEAAVGQNGPEGSIKLIVNRSGSLKTYESVSTFPIYRNTRTLFKATGEGLLIIGFGGTNGGINIDDDIWDGEENY